MATVPEYLVFKQERMAALRATLAVAEQPAIPLTATARVASGSGVRPVTVREFTIVTDSGPAMAGYNLGPTAPELLLSALASCLTHTFLLVAADRGLMYEALEVEVSGSIDFRGVLEVNDSVPIPPQNLRYEARITADLSPTQLAELQREVERLCPVLQALVQPMAIAGRVRVVGRGER